MSQPPPADERIATFLSTTPYGSRHPRLQWLTGDASDRQYVRVHLDGNASIVLAVHPGAIDYDAMPFSTIAALLERMKLPAPRVLGHSDALGIIAQEDLGDVTLQARVGGDNISTHEALYREAVELIHALQTRGRECVSHTVPYTLAFDVEKLTFEFNFFTTHFLGGYRGITLSPAEQSQLAQEFGSIVDELAAEPRVVCHRDYHSRNLMLCRDALYLIDFQDARMGPDTYDLASLLRDSYVDITEAERTRLIARFTALSGIVDEAEFRRRFDLMCVQRNIKALGTFGFQASVRGKRAYVADMPRTLRAVRDNLVKYERFAGLHALLGAHVEELR